MAKTIVKEIIIMLLICLAILLILSVLLYGFVPANKTIPREADYQAPAEIKEQLQQATQEATSQIILTYEVTSTDLKNYQKTNSYNAGKVNPFSEYVEAPEVTVDENDNENNSNNTNNNNTNNNNANNNTNSTENNSSGQTNDLKDTNENTTSENTGKYFETSTGK